ncbi:MULTISPECIES: cytochrome c nitrite reductase small subunit [unclassified Campylobacter]|uniref:cytochrome c nitrite reductase small subunit n=1 Tax=unclassified Campylobacter TaxID=2593542 RepID=UPI0012381BBF|nr:MULTISPECIES: cytochrome c nitrite reductase small subunit [unclassified Campylobacter]KAA6226442.1 cytochrome c nitrite reductase small subunit [Campylobacter sp. LR185c]KAA6228578.1 cytochrome c nitrite reductase small subunit [Campylobacter sp. LR196d]KAA6229131.1 cytochrome c nitrite reductase small subunit [Campylobacter sp. LR286c]KAA6234161.1 cytochrome c nitrite reductase small subunit [Campylobacter sp. LR264d]KAA8603502.1 cytochrome c nitrite reductase small subunit [Campylobacter
MEEKSSSSGLFGIFLILLFVFFAMGFYTFYKAKGTSYFGSASESCNNCHVMNQVYNDYLSGPHSKKVAGEPRASCMDCHLPHDFVNKWIAKAESGLRHAYAFTFELENLPTHLSANEKSKHTVQDNCIRCHADYAANAINATANSHANNSLSCVSCHASVGHVRGF